MTAKFKKRSCTWRVSRSCSCSADLDDKLIAHLRDFQTAGLGEAWVKRTRKQGFGTLLLAQSNPVSLDRSLQQAKAA